MARKQSEPKRECPPGFSSLIAILNEVPRNDRAVAELETALLAAYSKAFHMLEKFVPADMNNWTNMQSKNFGNINFEFLDTFKDSYPLTVGEIWKGFSDLRNQKETYKVAVDELNELRKERERLIAIINAFAEFDAKYDRMNPAFRFEIPGVTKMRFGPHGRKVFSSSRVLNALVQDGNLLERLFICPICEAIKWIKTTRTNTCGNPKCVYKFADMKRGKSGKKERNNGDI